MLTTHTQVPVVAQTCSWGEEEGGDIRTDCNKDLPRWLRIFFRRSKSSRILESSTVDVAWRREGTGHEQGIGRDGGVAARNIEEKGGDANLEGVALLPVALPVQEVSGDLGEKGREGAMGGEGCKKTTMAQ